MLRQFLSTQRNQLQRLLFNSKSIALSSTTMEPSSSQANNVIGATELKTKLNTSFPNATSIQVEDISGGCGAMFEIYVEAPEFKGMTKVKQHQLINTILKDEIRSMHGIRINTGLPKSPPQ